MVITESELRELWRDGRNPLPPFPAGTRFSPAAQDFLKAHRLEVQYEGQIPSPHFQVPSIEPQGSGGRPVWDRPGAFPVVLSGPPPVCEVCGQAVRDKPEHMTQLDAGHFALKTHPRVRLRGRMDSLHALLMLAAAEARRYQLPRLAGHLDSLAAYCREIQSAEYNARPPRPLSLAGRSEAELHEISHWPERHLGLAHIVPGADDHAILHWLNLARAMAREVEIDALQTYPPGPGADAGPTLARALNRLSSAVYVLELMFKAGQLGWQVSG